MPSRRNSGANLEQPAPRSTATPWWRVPDVTPLLLLVIACVLFHPRPLSAESVSRAQFRSILTELTARPDIPPRLVAPTIVTDPAGQLATRADQHAACALPRRDVVFSVPRRLPDTPGKPPRFEIVHQRLPVLADRVRADRVRAERVRADRVRANRVVARRGTQSRGAIFAVTDTFAVNADGSPRTYHPLDPFGRCSGEGNSRVCALDALCNAGTRLFEAGSEIKCSRREAYANAWTEMWGEISAGRAKPVPARYWRMDRSGRTKTHFGFFHPARPLTVVMRHNIIARDRRSRPCVRDVPNARYAGYFVSKTSLKGDQGADEMEGPNAASIVSDRRCNPLPYTNPEVLAGTVIPVGGFAGASVGDLAVFYRKDKEGQERFVYAIISDEGPNHKFGEGNIALNAALKGIEPNVESIKDIHALDIRSHGGWRERIGVLILRGTSRRHYASLARSDVEKAARDAFRTWGGGDLQQAEARYRACLAALP